MIYGTCSIWYNSELVFNWLFQILHLLLKLSFLILVVYFSRLRWALYVVVCLSPQFYWVNNTDSPSIFFLFFFKISLSLPPGWAWCAAPQLTHLSALFTTECVKPGRSALILHSLQQALRWDQIRWIFNDTLRDAGEFWHYFILFLY